MHEQYDNMPFDGREVTLLAGIRADGAALIAFPCACSGHSVAVMKADCTGKKSLAGQSSVLPLRGQRRLKVSALLNPGWSEPNGVNFLLLPVELRHVNHTASTNSQDSKRCSGAKAYNYSAHVQYKPN